MPEDQTHQYGIVGVEDRKAKVSRITKMVEKPPRGTAPSNLHITGRYILQPEIFDLLENQERGAGGEIQLTDSMIRLMDDLKQPFHVGSLRRTDLRLRLEDRLPHRQHRLRPGARRSRTIAQGGIAPPPGPVKPSAALRDNVR